MSHTSGRATDSRLFSLSKRVFSPLGVFDFAPESGFMRIHSLHPGVTVADVQAATGFEVGVPAGTAPTVRHFGRQPAGYHQLDTRSRLGGILYRIGVQLRPLAWFLHRRADEPWDDAWLGAADEARLPALARWLPRRPTLIVVEQPDGGFTPRVLAALSHAARYGDQPVRLLILDAAARPGLQPLG